MCIDSGMWPYIKATNTNNQRTGSSINWHRIDKENNDYFVFENNNSKIKCLKSGVIRIIVDICIPSGNYYACIYINGKNKKQNMHYVSNTCTIVMNEIFEINSNDYIEITTPGNPYNNSNENTRIQIEMLSVQEDIE